MNSSAVHPIIVIPVYRALPTDQEAWAIATCVDTLAGHQLAFVAPASLECAAYRTLCPHAAVERFHDGYFQAVRGYNELLTHRCFYERFRNFSHLLVYQTDAHVMYDRLIAWCRSGYDFIGAPWFDDWTTSHRDGSLWAVGNGGFSLRNVRSCLAALRGYRRIAMFLRGRGGRHALRWRLRRNPLLRDRAALLDSLVDSGGQHPWPLNEDVFWGMFIGSLSHGFRVAPAEVAVRFSFECDPRFLFEVAKRELPFGCHAWRRYDEDFWRGELDTGLREAP